MYKIGLGSGSSSSYRGWFLGLVCPILFFKIQNLSSRDLELAQELNSKPLQKPKTGQY